MALLTIVEDERTLARDGAERFARIVDEATGTRGRAVVSLTGGTTPRYMYEQLARRPHVPWQAVHVFWGDERAVGPDHPDSNYGMARDALLTHVPIPAGQIHRIRGELVPDEAARQYERELMGTFDLMLLGLGEDAHIASIFPFNPVIEERVRRVVAPWVPHLNTYRITLARPALLDARRILMVVAGRTKANAVKAALEAPTDVQRCPAHLLRSAADRVEWLIDRAAGQALSSRPS
jgi:6-phosphogluconolactonase